MIQIQAMNNRQIVPRTIKAIIWDFDGVIVDSMRLKTDAFCHVLSSFPQEEIKKFVAFHNANGGLSRFFKFRFFFEKILKQPAEEIVLEQMAKKFSDYVSERLADPKFLISDTYGFISSYHKKAAFHIASGSEENELKYLAGHLNISKFFRSINGSPTSKECIIANILKDYGYTANEVIMIGDSANDYNAAKYNYIAFYGYNNPALKKLDNCNYIEQFEFVAFETEL